MASMKKQTVRSIIKMESMEKRKKNIAYTFACECGKKYNSYPALYLHFKRNHNIKINTKITDDINETTRQQNERIFTYYYSKAQNLSSSNVEEINTEKQKVQNIFQEFLNENHFLELSHKKMKQILEKFRYFLNNIKNSFILQYNQIKVCQLPNFFNSFVMENQIKWREEQIYLQICQNLLIFGKWLYHKQYTHYQVIYWHEVKN